MDWNTAIQIINGDDFGTVYTRDGARAEDVAAARDYEASVGGYQGQNGNWYRD